MNYIWNETHLLSHRQTKLKTQLISKYVLNSLIPLAIMPNSHGACPKGQKQRKEDYGLRTVPELMRLVCRSSVIWRACSIDSLA